MLRAMHGTRRRRGGFRAWVWAASLLAIGSSTAACGDAVKQLLGLIGGGAPASTPPPVVVAPDDGAMQTFADALVAAANKGDVDALAALMDWDTLLARATAELGVSAATTADARKGLVDAAKARGILFALVDAVQHGDGVRFLKDKSLATHGERWATFRILQASGAFDHYGFLLNREGSGRVRAVDWRMLSMGEPVSAMLRRMLSPMQSNGF